MSETAQKPVVTRRVTYTEVLAGGEEVSRSWDIEPGVTEFHFAVKPEVTHGALAGTRTLTRTPTGYAELELYAYKARVVSP